MKVTRRVEAGDYNSNLKGQASTSPVGGLKADQTMFPFFLGTFRRPAPLRVHLSFLLVKLTVDQGRYPVDVCIRRISHGLQFCSGSAGIEFHDRRPTIEPFFPALESRDINPLPIRAPN